MEFGNGLEYVSYWLLEDARVLIGYKDIQLGLGDHNDGTKTSHADYQ